MDPYAGPEGVGRGLLVRDGAGSALYKMLIQMDVVEYETVDGQERQFVGLLTFDYALVVP